MPCMCGDSECGSCGVAQGTKTYPPTIEEVCQEEGIPYPYSEADMVAFVRECDQRGIVTNVSGEAWWKALRFVK